MGRPKTFDETAALDQAMQVFWAKGYAATSLTDLLAATGLSKSSLYETFGSKHDLFLKTLERYRDVVVARSIAALETDMSARAAIRGAFLQVVQGCAESSEPRGCFSNNCAVEQAARDPAACRRVTEVFGRFEAAFEAAIRRGQAAGEISPERDPKALARYLNTALNGLIVVSKTRPGSADLNDVVEITLKALD